jgi:hypothetical protein
LGWRFERTRHVAKQGSISFLKKRNKKLLMADARRPIVTYRNEQKFFGSFFQKRTAFLALTLLCNQVAFNPLV